jgi:hypothetical protein
MNRPTGSHQVRPTTNTRVARGGSNNSGPNPNNNAQGFSGVNRSNNSISSNRNINRSYGFNSGNGYGGGYGNGYGGYGNGYGHRGYGNGSARYVMVYIPGWGWVLVPIQALRGSLRGTW